LTQVAVLEAEPAALVTVTLNVWPALWATDTLGGDTQSAAAAASTWHLTEATRPPVVNLICPLGALPEGTLVIDTVGATSSVTTADAADVALLPPAAVETATIERSVEPMSPAVSV